MKKNEKRQRLIYALACPFTTEVHYIGKTTVGMSRPFSYLSSEGHTKKLNEWIGFVKELGQHPIVQVLEYVPKEIDLSEREKFWIQKHLEKGALLLNELLVTPMFVNSKLDNILNDIVVHPTDRVRRFIIDKRQRLDLTQKQLSDKSGVGLRFVRELEQGHKKSLNIGKIQEILNLFGCTLDVVKINKES